MIIIYNTDRNLEFYRDFLPSFDFWCNIIRGSKLFVKLFVVIDNKGSSKIDDLDLIEFLVLLQQDIFGIQITMNDMVLMAVVDATKNLFHQH